MPIGGYVVVSATITLTILDIVFHVFLIISAHTKNYRIMRIFYRYSIALLCVNLSAMALYIGGWVVFIIFFEPIFFRLLWSIILPALGTSVIMLLIQGYLIILVRSEFLKLKNISQFEFVNNASANAEGKCSANIEFEKGMEENVP
ncbi:uncharacterized protein LOC120631562 isoform X2 [Pararge aegeria]|nr:uncharacterized protein LOC120631562 isoform X2 [Pararge aegeria]